MEQKRKTRTWCGFLLLLVLLAVFLIWNLFAGSVQLSASQIGQILLGGGDDLTQKQIIMQIRLPRTAFAPTEVSISSVTAVFGAPVVIYMMVRRKAGRE